MLLGELPERNGRTAQELPHVIRDTVGEPCPHPPVERREELEIVGGEERTYRVSELLVGQPHVADLFAGGTCHLRRHFAPRERLSSCERVCLPAVARFGQRLDRHGGDVSSVDESSPAVSGRL